MNKRSFIALAFIAMLVVLAGCGARRSQAYYDYNSKIIASELDGAYTIRAFGRARNAVDAYEKAQKQAVRDVILLGVESSDATVKPLKALLLEVKVRGLPQRLLCRRRTVAELLQSAPAPNPVVELRTDRRTGRCASIRNRVPQRTESKTNSGRHTQTIIVNI